MCVGGGGAVIQYFKNYQTFGVTTGIFRENGTCMFLQCKINQHTGRHSLWGKIKLKAFQVIWYLICKISVFIKELGHNKTNILHMQKQRCRSASQ